MSFALTLTLAGTPHPLPRPRFVRGRVVSIASPRAKAYAAALQRAATEAVANLGGADDVAKAFAGHGLAVCILAEFPTRRRERWGQPHTIRPDADNIAKQLDRLMDAGALGGDDSRVASLTMAKRWAERGRLTVTVTVQPAQPATRPKRSNTTLQAPPAWLRR